MHRRHNFGERQPPALPKGAAFARTDAIDDRHIEACALQEGGGDMPTMPAPMIVALSSLTLSNPAS